MAMNLKMRPVWAEVNLDALADNVREVRRLTEPSALIMGVIKADAYGHGAVQIAQTLIENGTDRFGVAILDEAIELRKAGYSLPILVLGYTDSSQYVNLIRYDVEQTIYSYETAEALSREAERHKGIAKIHVKIDTGMRRIGFDPGLEAIEAIIQISKLPALDIVGIFSHFAQSDGADKCFAREQFEKFKDVCDMLGKANIHIPCRHIANSAAIIDMPEVHMDMVRAGIMLYCLSPSEGDRRSCDLKQVMTLKAKISNVKTIRAGESVGYGRTYIAEKPTVVATLPIGYADGYSRRLTGRAYVLVHGVRAPIIGRICMDQCMIDVTNVAGAKIDDEVVLFGTQGNACIKIDEIALRLGTINHEILCGISKRVPRVYIKNGSIIGYKNYLSDRLGLEEIDHCC